jgi:hypothetical protein
MFFKKAPAAAPTAVDVVRATFWGASDRMICCKGIGGETDEFNTTSHPRLASTGYVATLRVASPAGGQGLLIHAFYSGHWSFAVSPSEEDDDALPDWKIERAWGTVNAHSETLVIECPRDAVVEAVDRIVEVDE